MSSRQNADEATHLLSPPEQSQSQLRYSYSDNDDTLVHERQTDAATREPYNAVGFNTSRPKTRRNGVNFWGKLFATYYSFTLVGGIDGAYGILIHYFKQYYRTGYLGVSIILLSPVLGYIIAALVNEKLHRQSGQRGIAVIGPSCHLIAFVGAAQHPPYPLLVFFCVLAGLGSGLVDAGWNAWIGAMPDSSGLLGALHGFYGLGAALTPVLATALIEKAGWQWYHFYYLLSGTAAVELGTSVVAFWPETGARHRANKDVASDSQDRATLHDAHSDAISTPADDDQSHSLFDALRRLSTYIISLFIFLYAGVELSFADWILTVLVDVRHESEITGSAVTFAYWGGLTIGRVVIGFLISIFRVEKHHVTASLILVLAFQLVFALTSNLPLTTVALFLVGFFHGPLFPEAVIMQTRLLPKSLHIAAVGFSCALGSAGGAVMPFVIGAIANRSSINVLHPALTVMIVIMMGLWLVLPRPSTRRA